MMKVERYWLVAILKMRYLAIVKVIQYDGTEFEGKEDKDNSKLALVIGLIEVFLCLGEFWLWWFAELESSTVLNLGPSLNLIDYIICLVINGNNQ